MLKQLLFIEVRGMSAGAIWIFYSMEPIESGYTLFEFFVFVWATEYFYRLVKAIFIRKTI